MPTAGHAGLGGVADRTCMKKVFSNSLGSPFRINGRCHSTLPINSGLAVTPLGGVIPISRKL
jgi:hypothetical protein